MTWDIAISTTAKKINTNHPDICFRNNKTNSCIFTDISCPADGNIIRKHAEKLTEYSDLWMEVSPVWQCQTDTGRSSGVGSTGRSARRYCTVTGHHFKLPQPVALTKKSS